MQQGLYEQIINKLISSKLEELNRDQFYINEVVVDKYEAAKIFSQYLSKVIEYALDLKKGENGIENQIALCNKVIQVLRDEIPAENFNENFLENGGKILSAVFSKKNFPHKDFEKYLKEITPYTKLSQSFLFTGSGAGISLESEIKKEILSSNKIFFLVSFIKWTGIRIFEKELTEYTNKGGELKVITTSYMGATDYKAIEFLSNLQNTQIKISYNTQNERLHAKAYLFYRNTDFHTAYIGSSNISRSALTNGLEWNVKFTTKEVSQIIDTFQKTFDAYWNDKEFLNYEDALHKEKLKLALKNERTYDSTDYSVFFDIKPYNFQEEILEKLQAERVVHNRFKNLIVAATGTGKTIISAFDYKNFIKSNPNAKLLFVAHRKEILEQARKTFQAILRNNNFGQLWVDGIEPDNYNHVFASVQTINSKIDSLFLDKSFYDYIVIDEVHHIAASSYRVVLEKFEAKVLLGLTATPERMDGEDILKDFCDTIAAEIRLPEALNLKLLCPFQYFGISDSVDLSNVEWKNGKYVPGELSKIYTNNDARVGEIIFNLNKYLRDLNEVRALCFCVTKEHAKYMADKFLLAGLKADCLVSEGNNREHRHEVRIKLQNKEINYLFVVDIFNEGVDIPEIDTVLFLRPTESLTVFLQQLGRGLRLAEGKECLSVLDFVGNSRPEYDFEGKFRALVGKTNTPIQKEIEDEFPHLPLGCSIILEEKAKENILNNIRKATSYGRTRLIQKIRNYSNQTTLPLTLKNFSEFYHIPLQQIYKSASWKRLCVDANIIEKFPTTNEKEIVSCFQKKWLSCNADSYFEFIFKLAKQNFKITYDEFNEVEKAMCLMLHYDIWTKENGFNSIEESIESIGKNKILVEEIIQVLEILIDRIDFIEKEIELPYKQPLKVHSRYTREQILSAFGFHTFENKKNIIEGVADSKEKNTELLFITLDKSEKDFSPTTFYNDFAINENLFHWQSQNASRPDAGKGLSYVHHKKLKKKILLFVRERNQDEFGNTMGFVFLGEGDIKEHYGSKPMNVKWELKDPMPPYIYKDSAKMAVS